MKSIIIAALLFTLGYCGTNLQERSFKVSPGGMLSIKIKSAEIIINIWKRNEVQLLLDDDESLKAEHRGNSVYLSSGSSETFSVIKINIPENYNVSSRTSAGDLRINGDLKGDLEIENTGGNIHFNNVMGSIKILTGGGSIKGNNIGGNTKVNSSGGDITLGRIKGRCSVETGGGNIKIADAGNIEIVETYGGNIMMKSAGGSGEISTGGGNIELNSVSGSLTLNSYGGDIRISSASGRISGKTGGGTIRMKNLKGSLKAESNSGDVYLDLVSLSGTTEINSGDGNIWLTVNPGVRATIYTRVNDPEWWRSDNPENERIKSDYKPASLKRNKSSQSIETIYELNGGGTKILLKANYGEVIIRKRQ